MLRSDFKLALRRLIRNRFYSLTNLFGLSLGFASVLIIYLFVQKEYSFDRFHEDAQDIYRLTVKKQSDGNFEHSAGTSAAIIPFIREHFPAVESTTRYSGGGSFSYADSLTATNKDVRLDFLTVDSDFFRVFTFNLLAGQYPDFEKDPLSTVITKNKAQAIFGSIDSALGQSIVAGRNRFKIVGVLDEIPLNSSISFHVAVSLTEANRDFPAMLTNWGLTWANSVVRFHEATTTQKRQEILDEIDKAYGEQVATDQQVTFAWQPLSAMHFDVGLRDGVHNKIDSLYLDILSAIALIVLVCSITNYTSLTLSQSVERVKEIGVRRVIGAHRMGLLMSFLVESVLLTSLAFVLSLIVVELTVPQLERVLNRQLHIELFSQPSLLIKAYLTVVCTALLSVSYPALLVSKKRLSELKGVAGLSVFNKSKFINLINGFQLAVFLFLVTCTVLVNRQFHFIQNENLGFHKDNILIVNVNTREAIVVKDELKETFLNSPYVVSASFALGYPSARSTTRFSEERRMSYHEYKVEPAYFDVFGLEIIQGRELEPLEHYLNYVIVNETAASYYGEGPVIGEQLDGREIIGIVKDFHTESKREPIRPLAIRLFDADGFGRLAVRLKGERPLNAVTDLRQRFEQVTASTKFSYRFFDDEFDKLYSSEMVIARVMKLFTGIAFFIAILGILGTNTYMLKRRIKEISIRKILGAGLIDMGKAINASSLLRVIVAAAFAFPLSHFWFSSWLNGFAYQIVVKPLNYLLVLCFTMLVILPVITLQLIRVYYSKSFRYLKEE